VCIENWSENIILVDVPGEPGMDELLEDVALLVDGRTDCDVVLDCSTITHMGCSSYRQLLQLGDTLNACGHQLVLCGSQHTVRNTWASDAHAGTLTFADDRFTALAQLGLAHA
jgi:anti-anti-sigma factor